MLSSGSTWGVGVMNHLGSSRTVTTVLLLLVIAIVTCVTLIAYDHFGFRELNVYMQNSEPTVGNKHRPLSIHMVVIPYFAYEKASNNPVIRARQEEYRTALQRNLNHKLVSKVHVLTTNVTDTRRRLKIKKLEADTSKLVLVQVKSVDYMRDPWEYISQNLVGKDAMFANADIYLGDGFELVDPEVMAQQRIMYSLTRRLAPDEKCGKPDFCLERTYISSHDVFLVHLTKPLPRNALLEMEFALASLGMESRLLWIFKEMLNFCELNPCEILQTFHLHCTELRNRHNKHRVNVENKYITIPFTNALLC